MTTLVLLALAGIVAKLWSDVRVLRHRLAALESDGGSVATLRAAQVVVPPPISPPVARQSEPPVQPRPVARVVHSATTPAPPVASDVAPGEAPHVQLPPARVAEAKRTPEVAAPAPVQSASLLSRARGFEDIFGRKLPIWAGGVTLAVCGFLIVKYSIDAGLLSPWIRVLGGLLFGAGLITGAEAALRNEERVRDPRVRQALAGAGVATLYASVLVATNLYALIPPLMAFGGLALITVLAAFLSVRFGAPSAVLGLVGGLAAPALVGTGTPNIPLLAGYLALAVGGLATLGRAQRWWWLGAAALVGGFGWGAALLLTGALDVTDSLSIGALLLLLGVGLPALLFDGARGAVVRLLGTLAAAAQLAALVATGGFGMLQWGLFGLLAAASVWLSRREQALADLPVPALATALLLMAAWPSPTPRDLALVLGAATLIFGLPAAWRVWRCDGRLSDAGTVAALAAALVALAFWQLNLTSPTAALLALAGAGAAAGIAAFGWPVASRRDDARFATLTATAALLLALAAAIELPSQAIAPAWAAIAAGLIVLANRAGDRRVERFAWSAAMATLDAFVLTPGRANPLDYAAGEYNRASLPLEALRWAVGAAAAIVFALLGRLRSAAPVGASAAVLLGYVALAQLLPPSLLPLIPAVALAALGWSRRSDAATLTAAALSVAWAAWPLVQWLGGAGGALVGIPLFVTALPGPFDTATRLFAPVLAGALVLWRHPLTSGTARRGCIAGLGLLGGAAAHVAFKQLFAIDNAAEFVRLGLAERTVWEALLALAALGLATRLPQAARALGVAALAHFTWFTLVLHNPLWSEQAVGAWPVANLLLPAYALGFALLWAAGRFSRLPAGVERARGWGQMALVLLFAASQLRQLVQGSTLVGGNLSQAEDIARSVLAIGVAIGFLQWGIRRRARDWRIASLVVMLGAVLKVFLLDTSGLDGLLRIGSFAALGFSLIGIGWLYSRTLRDDGNTASVPA